MILRTLALNNFRSYKNKIKFDFSPGLNIIIGHNTSGKTNILESLYLIATGKSFRADSEKDMVYWESQIGRVSIDTLEDKLEVVVTVGDVNGKKTQIKKYMINSLPKRMIDFVGRFKAVLFWPEDIELVTGSPQKRRKYLDQCLVQSNREYRRNLYSYERGLRQRNRILFNIFEGRATRSQLIYWDHLLITTGEQITNERQKYIDFINSEGVKDHDFRLIYDKSIISPLRIKQYENEEIQAKSTLVGPHRDDFSFQMNTLKSSKQNNWVNLSSFGSRGQQRLSVLWIKLRELNYLSKEAGDRPVLLLDDIFSELDDDHRNLVFELIKSQQTIITSAESELLDSLGSALVKPNIIYLNNV